MWEKANNVRFSSVKSLLILAVTRNLFHSRVVFPFQREWHNIYSHIDNNEKLFLFIFCLLLTNSTIAQEKHHFPTIPNIPKQCVIRETINTTRLIFIPNNAYRYFDAKTPNLELSCYQLCFVLVWKHWVDWCSGINSFYICIPKFHFAVLKKNPLPRE